MFIDAKDNNSAINILESLTNKITSRIDLFLIMGQIYSEMKQADKSYEAYKKALSLDPKSINALYGIGAYYVNKSNTFVQEHNNLDESKTNGKEGQVILNEINKSFDKAIHYFELLLEVDPKDRSTLNALKKIYEMKKDQAKVDAINQKLIAE